MCSPGAPGPLPLAGCEIPPLKTLNKFLPLIAGLVVFLTGAIMSRDFGTQLALAEAAADSARAEAQRALAQSAADSAAAVKLRAEAKALDAARSVAVARADSIAHAARRLRSSFASVARTAPDTCRTIAVLADSALALHDSIEAGLRSALTFEQEARSRVEVALDTTAAALSRLRASSAKLVVADAALAKRSRPSFLARILPRPGVGVAAGLDPSMHPRVITGITLSWSF